MQKYIDLLFLIHSFYSKNNSKRKGSANHKRDKFKDIIKTCRYVFTAVSIQSNMKFDYIIKKKYPFRFIAILIYI